MNLPAEQLREFLEEKYRQYNRPEFIETDPVSIPHLFTGGFKSQMQLLMN
jgi:hypothetical protein